MSAEDENPHSPSTRVIIVEDSFHVADGLRCVLQSLGVTVAGMAGSVKTALDLVANAVFDIAVLDIDLHGVRVTPVADAVRAQGKPLVFLSGYGDADLLPAHLQTCPRLEKPVDPEQLLATIDQVLGSPLTG